MTPDRIAELAREAGFGDIAGELAKLAAPGLRLRPDEGEAAVGATKLGGSPDLPADTPWPTLSRDGTAHGPLAFFGQFALAGLDPAVWPGPRDGLLSVFCYVAVEYMGVDGEGLARVLRIPAGEPLQRRPPPEGLDEELRFAELPVTAVPDLSLPYIGVEPAVALAPFGFDWGEPRHDRVEDYFALVERLAVEQGFEARGPAHRLLGWPRHVQGDVIRELAPPGERGWRLLLEIDADARLGTSFGDGGNLYLAMPEEDLPEGRFDRVEAGTQST